MIERVRGILITALCFGLGAACSTTLEEADSEGNTNWLGQCDSDAACGEGLDCVCGVCTRACAGDGACSGLDSTAVCLEPSGDGVRECGSTLPAGEGLCVPSCASAPCGEEAECVANVCVPKGFGADDGSDAGAGGASAGAGGTGGGAEAGSGGTAGAAGTSACEEDPALAGSRPSASEVATPGGDIDFLAVMYSADLGDRTWRGVESSIAYRSIGLDLDGRCGYEDPVQTDCTLPSWASGVPDGQYGTDNAAGALFQSVRDLMVGFSSESYSTHVYEGGTSLMFRVSGYNGETNDDEVALATFVTAPYGALAAGDAGASAPSWDGTECWPIAARSVADPSDPLGSPMSEDRSAFVRDGMIHARHPQLALRVVVPVETVGMVALDVTLTDARLTCAVLQLTLGGPGWRLEQCVLGGRWRTDDLLHSLSRFPDPSTLNPSDPDGVAEPLCTDSSLYCSFRSRVCQSTDIASVSPTASLEPEGECDALSFGMLLATRPACAGDVVALDPLVDPCPEGTRPSDDTCRLESPPGSPACR